MCGIGQCPRPVRVRGSKLFRRQAIRLVVRDADEFFTVHGIEHGFKGAPGDKGSKGDRGDKRPKGDKGPPGDKTTANRRSSRRWSESCPDVTTVAATVYRSAAFSTKDLIVREVFDSFRACFSYRRATVSIDSFRDFLYFESVLHHWAQRYQPTR